MNTFAMTESRNRDIQLLLDQMTLQEKAMLCSGKDFWHLHGIERLDLPSIMLTDGPHGVRKQTGAADHVGLNESVPATCFPTASGLAASWNRELLQEIGEALGRECRAENISVLLGPGINIKRHPLGGRNFEYFSEDPFLSGEMAKAWINGVQSQRVGASLKHFAANNHEQGRMVVDIVVDQRTLREIYLPAFETCVKETQPWTIMSSYNKLNGTYVSEHQQLLTDILQDEWGYEGLVVTDWGANHNRVAGLNAGQSLEMPANGEVSAKKIIAAVNNGELSMATLDHSVGRVLNLILKARKVYNQPLTFSVEAHHQLARKAAEQACVLLKNDGELLPLSKEQQALGVIGALATHTRYQGSGSSQIVPTKLEQPRDEIEKHLASGNLAYAQGYPIQGKNSPELIAQALAIAETCERIIVIAGLTPEYESEGFDRSHMHLPEAQLQLIEALKPYYHKLILVLQNGAPVELPFAAKIPCILEAYLGGQAGASALANILFGIANPSGKLAETFPVKVEDVGCHDWFPGQLRQCQYRESIWVGYRYFDSAQVPVAFPFGHGLSYTQFEYSNLVISGSNSLAGRSFILAAQDHLHIEFTLKNVGGRAGAEIVQLYVGQHQSSVPRPAKELKAFNRVELAAGEEKQIALRLNYRDFAFWSLEAKQWQVESAAFTLLIGASVADIRLSQTIALKTDQPLQAPNPALACYFSPGQRQFTSKAFATLLGYSIPSPLASKPYQINSSLQELQDHWLGRLVLRMAKKQMLAVTGEKNWENAPPFMEMMLNQMPLRALMAFSNGKLSEPKVNALLHIMNGHWGKLLLAKPARSE